MQIRIVALTGPAGSGKDTVAARLVSEHKYTRFSFAAPMYRIVSLLSAMYKGDKAAPHELMKLVTKLFGGPLGAPSLTELAQIVEHDLPHLAEEHGMYEDIAVKTKPRKFLQFLGTEYFRAISEDIWCDYLANEITAHVYREMNEFYDRLEIFDLTHNPEDVPLPPMVSFVITDLRFDNEAVCLRKLGQRLMEFYPEEEVFVNLVGLDVPREVAAARVAGRDFISVEDVMANMGHASEHGVNKGLLDTTVDATGSIDEVTDLVLESLDTINIPKKKISIVVEEENKPVADIIPGTNLIDLSKFARSKK